MKRMKKYGLGLIVLAASCQAPLALATCHWSNGTGPIDFRHNLGSVYVPRDAAVGSVIGQYQRTINVAGGGPRINCNYDGNVPLNASLRNSKPLFGEPLPPINGQDVNGKVIQTNIRGVGIMFKMDFEFDGSQGNSFIPVGPPIVPFESYLERMHAITWVMSRLVTHVTLVKTGPIDPGPQQLDGSEVFSGNFSNIGKGFGFSPTGMIIQAQCSVSANPVSANPINLGEWQLADFSGPDHTTEPMAFDVTLNACVADPDQGDPWRITTAHIRLEGANGSIPIDAERGLFSLSNDSTASGLGIQMLRNDGSTPVRLLEEVPITAIAPTGSTILPFMARFVKTDATVTAGTANGSLNFTVTYK